MRVIRYLREMLLRGPATIDGDGLSVEEPPSLAAQEQRGSGDFRRFAETPHRAGLEQPLQQVPWQTLIHLRIDRAGADRVHGKAFTRIFERGSLGKAHHTVLGGNIGGKSRRSHQPGNRCAIDDRAARSEEHTSELQSLMRISYAV